MGKFKCELLNCHFSTLESMLRTCFARQKKAGVDSEKTEESTIDDIVIGYSYGSSSLRAHCKSCKQGEALRTKYPKIYKQIVVKNKDLNGYATAKKLDNEHHDFGRFNFDWV